MIASKPVRLLSLAIVALVVIVGIRGIVGGFAFGGDLLDTRSAGSDTGERGQRTAGVVAYVLDGDTVQVDLRDGRDVRVRLLGIVH
jgi:micrococcal nuclease